jgi:hypothetical protein
MLRTHINGYIDAHTGKASYVVAILLTEVFRVRGPQYEIRREDLPVGSGRLNYATHPQDVASLAAMQAHHN